jgi:hypothetical protein
VTLWGRRIWHGEEKLGLDGCRHFLKEAAGLSSDGGGGMGAMPCDRGWGGARRNMGGGR